MTRSSRPFWLGEDGRGWDHVRLHIQVYRDPRMGAYEQSVYGGIACHAELQTGEATPSLETLASYARCDERTVRRVLTRLEEWHYISIERRKGKASVYRLLPPPSADTESGVGDEGADTEPAPPRTQSPTGADTESDEQERAIEQEPLTPQNGVTPREAGTNPRALGESPRQKVLRREFQQMLDERARCPECSLPSSECTRHHGWRTKLEGQLRDLKVPREVWRVEVSA